MALEATPPRGGLHPLATAVMSVFILLSAAFGAALHGKRFRVYSLLSLATTVVFGVLVSLQAPALTANAPTPCIGLLERVNIYAWMLWIAVLAISLWPVAREPTGQRAPALGKGVA